MPLENPNLRRGPAFPKRPKQQMTERTWRRVKLQSLFITKPWLTVAQMAEYAAVDEEEVIRWRGL